MNATTATLTGAFSLLAMTVCPGFTRAQDKADIAIDRYSCRDVLRETGPDREVALAFIHGYIFGQAGKTSVSIETLRKQSAAFIERCLDNPQAGAVATMTAVGNAAPGARPADPK